LHRFCKKLNSRGSITVEACVVFPIFISVFFLLLFLIKFTCTGMALDYAVNEAAKEIAAAAYPISFVNELEDEKLQEYGNTKIPTLEEELEKLVSGIAGTSFDNILGVIISENLKETDFTDAVQDVLKDYSRGIIGNIVDVMAPAYWDMKSAVKYSAAEAIIKKHLESPLINRENIKLQLVEFPQGREEYSVRSSSAIYGKLGLIPEKDFSRDDIVLQLSYDYKVNLPFLGPLNIRMIHTAVERAWINGSFGILTADDEGFNLESEGRIVYITRTGIRYHEEDCRYLRKSKIPIIIEEAEGSGYTPCKVCKPLG
jgi:hypothetical protein